MNRTQVESPGGRRRPTLRERSVATRQLAVMIRSGMPLERAVGVLARQEGNSSLAQAWQEVHLGLLQGRTLSRGMARHSETFGLLEVGLTRAGEASGALVPIFGQLADLQEREVRLQERFRAALAYPSLVGVVCLALAGLMVGYVLPTLLTGFLRGVQDLPWITRTLLTLTRMAWDPAIWVVTLGTATVGFPLVGMHLQTPHGGFQLQKTLLGLPLLGGVCRKTLMVRFCRTLATLLSSSMPLVGALQVAASALANGPLAEALEEVCLDLGEGGGVAESFGSSGFFPSMVLSMVAVGEEAGDLAGPLLRLAEFYEQDLELSLNSLTSLLEPVVVGVVGSFVGVVLLALFLPVSRVLVDL